MKVDEIEKVAVIGFGTMGAGIAQTFAQAGYQVVARDVANDFLKRGLENIKTGPFGLTRSVEKGRITKEQAEATISRIKVTTDVMEAVADADFVIEAILENLDAKRKLFREIGQLTPNRCIMVSNTSSLSITAIASATDNPQNVAGMHFFNPVPVMKLVEVIRGILTSDETSETVKNLAERLGKTPVMINKDIPGFVANRIGQPGILEAIRLYEQGVASARDIDNSMKLGFNWPMGPLELADMVGLDVVLDIAKNIYKETGNPVYNPPITLRQMVRARLYGRKTKKGFYTY